MTRLTAACVIAVGATLLISASPCPAGHEHESPEPPVTSGPTSSRSTSADELFGVRGDLTNPDARDLRSVGEDTLWIFDADFEDLTGDNAGWTSLDMSGTLEQVNYWHKDTIRINGFEHLGDSTWVIHAPARCLLQHGIELDTEPGAVLSGLVQDLLELAFEIVNNLEPRIGQRPPALLSQLLNPVKPLRRYKHIGILLWLATLMFGQLGHCFICQRGVGA